VLLSVASRHLMTLRHLVWLCAPQDLGFCPSGGGVLFCKTGADFANTMGR
jgi:hypothetical protein